LKWSRPSGGPIENSIFITVPQKYSIEGALSAICKTANAYPVKPNITFLHNLCYSWDRATNTAKLFLKRENGGDPFTNYSVQITSVDDGFWELFNVRVSGPKETDGPRTTYLTKTNEWVFPSVWDRKDVCVHASFVNNAAFHYLGRDGYFYPIPSKVFYQNFTDNDFEVYLTRDGVTPLNLLFQEFSIELSFLIDRNHYQE
jgi:hypothetical protein